MYNFSTKETNAFNGIKGERGQSKIFFDTFRSNGWITSVESRTLQNIVNEMKIIFRDIHTINRGTTYRVICLAAHNRYNPTRTARDLDAITRDSLLAIRDAWHRIADTVDNLVTRKIMAHVEDLTGEQSDLVISVADAADLIYNCVGQVCSEIA